MSESKRLLMGARSSSAISATLDTINNYIPARFTTTPIVLFSAISGEDYQDALAIAQRDHARVPSRNHGCQMAVTAGALREQLEKPSRYVIGDPIEEEDSNKTRRTLKIRNAAIVLCIFFMLPILSRDSICSPVRQFPRSR